MRQNGSRSPSFILVGMGVVIVILGFNYWSASSKNSILNEELTLANRRNEEVRVTDGDVSTVVYMYLFVG